MRNLNKIIWFLAVTMFFIVLLYFIKFHGKLSDSKTDWGTFGDYLSGVFSMFNLAVVVFLAYYVKSSEDERRKEDLKFQQQRHGEESNFNQYRLAKEIESQKAIFKADLEYKKKSALLELNFGYLKSFEKSFANLICTNYINRTQCLINVNIVINGLLNITAAFESEQIPSLMGEETLKLNNILRELRIAVFDSSEEDFYSAFSSRVVALTDLKLDFVKKIRKSMLLSFDNLIE